MITHLDHLKTALTAALPDTYQVVAGAAAPDRLAKDLVHLVIAGFEPSPNAPRARYAADITVTVVTRKEGVTTAADTDADTLTFEVWEALDALPWANPTRATKEVWRDRHLAYEITTEILLKRSTP